MRMIVKNRYKLKKIWYNNKRGKKILKIYFDSCIYNRPYDDQTQAIIQNETNAIIDIINSVKTNRFVIYGSLAVEMEI